ncbi:GDP-6-deoxy-D-mannose reductase [Pelotomaculum schinkii]|uniref:GDP-6-deoxy-D-mannose reductase n=1 Tax=Pelotomaculum schinkii TaxID=78350 RepID=A0A4Y7R918_9FIRM|nr:NAD-dependent epimerase/dehydratase family protein [Pelotomaculum schinkii]TEB05272.1 GDP-6-deoxy-D-mannose reductase [Pelotomaculum schinkii]
MKVLVTGATGFVGSCLTRRLVDLEYDVHIFTRRNSNKWRIKDLLGRVAEYEVDLRDAGNVAKEVLKIAPAIICHLATYGGFAFQKTPSVIIESNLIGTINLLRACEKTGFDCFINTGSSSEYGIKTAPMSECDILEPVGDYGVSKAAATLFCRSEAIVKKLPIVTLRLFSPYGPWDDPKRLIPYVIKSLLRGEPPVLSVPEFCRDFVYIDDVLDGYLKVMKTPLTGGEIFNIGSGKQHSIGEVVSLITNMLGNGLEPRWGMVNSHRPEPGSWVADIGKIKTKLGWLSNTSLWEGLKKTTAWIRENLELYP